MKVLHVAKIFIILEKQQSGIEGVWIADPGGPVLLFVTAMLDRKLSSVAAHHHCLPCPATSLLVVVELAKVGPDGSASEVLGGAPNDNKMVRATVGCVARPRTISSRVGFDVGTAPVGFRGRFGAYRFFQNRLRIKGVGIAASRGPVVGLVETQLARHHLCLPFPAAGLIFLVFGVAVLGHFAKVRVSGRAGERVRAATRNVVVELAPGFWRVSVLGAVRALRGFVFGTDSGVDRVAFVIAIAIVIEIGVTLGAIEGVVRNDALNLWEIFPRPFVRVAAIACFFDSSTAVRPGRHAREVVARATLEGVSVETFLSILFAVRALLGFVFRTDSDLDRVVAIAIVVGVAFGSIEGVVNDALNLWDFFHRPNVAVLAVAYFDGFTGV